MQQSWSTAQQIADFFQVKLPTIRAWTRGGMPCLRAGRLVRFDAQKVQEWLEQKQQESTRSDTRSA